MRTTITFCIVILISSNAFGQLSKQIGRIYDENNYRQVILLGSRFNTYASSEEEKVMDDFMGRSYYALQMYDSAFYFESKALTLDNDATLISGWAYAYRGMALYRLGKKEAGIADLKKAVALDKTHNSVEVAKDFLNNANNNSVVPDDKYRYYFSQRQYKSAIDEGKKQLLTQEYTDVMEIVGASYYHLHNYDSTIYYERKVLAADKGATMVSGWAHTYLGMALYHNNNKKDAVAELTKAISADKTSASVRTAENFLDNMINGRALPVDSLHLAIREKLNNGRYRAAADIAIGHLATDPEDAFAWAQLSIAYCRSHNYDSSLYCGQRAVSIDRDQTMVSCEAHYYMGIDRYMKNNKDAAEAEFAKAVNEHMTDELRKKVKRTMVIVGMNENYDDWKTVETDNIVFHFQSKKHMTDVDGFMEWYNNEYHKASSILTDPLPKKIDVFVWQKEAFFRSGLQAGNGEESNYSDLCISHVTDDNTRDSQIMHILGHWQKKDPNEM